MSIEPWTEDNARRVRIFDPSWQPGRVTRAALRHRATRGDPYRRDLQRPLTQSERDEQITFIGDCVLLALAVVFVFLPVVIGVGFMLNEAADFLFSPPPSPSSPTPPPAPPSEEGPPFFAWWAMLTGILAAGAVACFLPWLSRWLRDRFIAVLLRRTVAHSLSVKRTSGRVGAGESLLRRSHRLAEAAGLWDNDEATSLWARNANERLWALARREAAIEACDDRLDVLTAERRNLPEGSGSEHRAIEALDRRVNELRVERAEHIDAADRLVAEWTVIVDDLTELADRTARNAAAYEADREIAAVGLRVTVELGRPVSDPDVLAVAESSLTGTHLIDDIARARLAAKLDAMQELPG